MNNALVVQYMSPYMIILLLQLWQHSLSLHIYLSSDTNNFTVTTGQKIARLTQCNSTLTTTLNMWTERCHHRKAWTNKGCYKAKSLQIVNLTMTWGTPNFWRPQRAHIAMDVFGLWVGHMGALWPNILRW